MSKIISVLNYKGGTGKTTTAVNLAAGLAIRGERVLCIDLDAQGNLAAHLGVQHPRVLRHMLLGRAEPESCIVGARDNLDLIISDESLQQVEGALWQLADSSAAHRVFGNKMRSINGYEYIILDHSPSASLVNESGLFFTREIIVPVSMEYLALLGVRQVIGMMNSIASSLDNQVQIALVVPTFYDPRLRKDREIMEILQRHFGDRVTEPIHTNVCLSEAPGHRMSIYEYAPRSTGAVDYALLVERVAANGK